MSLRLVDGRRSALCRQLFEEFVGPCEADIRRSSPSVLWAFVEWWGRRGLANYEHPETANCAVAAIAAMIGPSLSLRGLPWRMPVGTAPGPARLLEWWPSVEGSGSVFDSPVGVIGGGRSDGEEVEEALDTLVDVAAAGGHNITIVDRYAFKQDHRSRLERLVSRAARGRPPNRFMIMAEAAAGEDEVEFWRRQATRPDRPWLVPAPWGPAPRFQDAFHDRFVLVDANDPEGRFRNRPEIVCLMLGKGLHALSRGAQSVSTVMRIPPGRCGEITRAVSTAIARNRWGSGAR